MDAKTSDWDKENQARVSCGKKFHCDLSDISNGILEILFSNLKALDAIRLIEIQYLYQRVTTKLPADNGSSGSSTSGADGKYHKESGGSLSSSL
uniref:Uncharacterized protein n=1 Tax=Romanomermis culicivorax TaxID=13658 RepID=A0A915L4H9_ROMCU